MTREYCPTCGGKGTIPNLRANGKALYLPEIECPNCNGEGFIGLPDNLFKKGIIDRYRTNRTQSRKVVEGVLKE